MRAKSHSGKIRKIRSRLLAAKLRDLPGTILSVQRAASDTEQAKCESALGRPLVDMGALNDALEAIHALAETSNGLYKAEVIHRHGPWRSFEAVEFGMLTWVDWFNNRQLFEPIGNIPPAEAEARFYAMFAEQKLAA